MQRTTIAAGRNLRFSNPGLVESQLSSQCNERIDLVIQSLDPRQKRLHHLHRRNRFRTNQFRQFSDAFKTQGIVHVGAKLLTGFFDQLQRYAQRHVRRKTATVFTSDPIGQHFNR